MACFFIVYHHGGKIEAKSKPGHGTIFTVRLPLNPDRATATEENRDFVQKMLLNQSLWEKLASSG